MRVMVFSTAGYGHWLPLAPLVRALGDAGHEVAVCAPAALAEAVTREGLALYPRPELPPARVADVRRAMAGLGREEANRLFMREMFGALNLESGLNAARGAIASFRPAMLLAEEAEVTSLATAGEVDVPLVWAAIGLSLFGHLCRVELGAAINARGLQTGRPRARLTPVPKSFDSADLAELPARRFRPGRAPVESLLPDWPGNAGAPLVYMTLGTEAGGMPFFPELVGRLFEVASERDVRVMFTTGQLPESVKLPSAPPNVRVESWFPQDALMRSSSAVISHGGFGTTMAALAAGVPSVNLPLFALDQHWNAARIEAVGAGLAVEAHEPTVTRDVGRALDRVLGDRGFSERAAAIAAEAAALAPLASAVELMESFTG